MLLISTVTKKPNWMCWNFFIVNMALDFCYWQFLVLSVKQESDSRNKTSILKLGTSRHVAKSQLRHLGNKSTLQYWELWAWITMFKTNMTHCSESLFDMFPLVSERLNKRLKTVNKMKTKNSNNYSYGIFRKQSEWMKYYHTVNILD